jgi:hypothetical protein
MESDMHANSRGRRLGSLLGLVIWLGLPGASPAADPPAKPVFLYSRHYNAAGENRYLPDGTFKELLARLRQDFEVRVHDLPLNQETLKDVKVVLIANPSDKAVSGHPTPPHMIAADRQMLTSFIRRGGGLILTYNQEDHNLEMEESNKLIWQFGILATNVYTDGKLLRLPAETPIIGGLRWAYFTGNQLVVAKTHAANPRILVANDLAQKPLKGTRDAEGCLLATAEPGQGRLVVATDSGWLNDAAFKGEVNAGLLMKDQDNWEIFRRLAVWAAHADEAGRTRK